MVTIDLILSVCSSWPNAAKSDYSAGDAKGTLIKYLSGSHSGTSYPGYKPSPAAAFGPMQVLIIDQRQLASIENNKALAMSEY